MTEPLVNNHSQRDLLRELRIIHFFVYAPRCLSVFVTQGVTKDQMESVVFYFDAFVLPIYPQISSEIFTNNSDVTRIVSRQVENILQN